MKTFKKLSALLIAAIMVFAMAMPAMAAEGDEKIKITGLTAGDEVTVYQIATVDEHGNIDPVDGIDAFEDWYAPKSQEINTAAQGISDKLSNVLTGDEGKVTSETWEKQLDAGIYIAVIKSSTGTIYNPILLATTNVAGVLKVKYDAEGKTALDMGDKYAWGDTAQAKSSTSDASKEIVGGTTADDQGSDDNTANKGEADRTGDGVYDEDDIETADAAKGVKTVDNYEDIIDYQVRVTVPAYPDDAKNQSMWMRDTLDKGIDYCAEDDREGTPEVVVRVNGVEYKESDQFTKDEVTVARIIRGKDDNGKTYFELVFNYMAIKGNQYVDVLYWGKLNDQCEIGRKPNLNTMEYYYTTNTAEGNDYWKDEEKPNKDFYEVKDDEAVYTYKVAIVKVNEEGEYLEGAEFDIYKADESGKPTGDKLNSESLKTNKDGYVAFEDKTLAAGDYVFVETKAPEGYKTPEDVNVKVTANWTTAVYKSSSKAYTTEENGTEQVGWLLGGKFYTEKPNDEKAKPAYLAKATDESIELVNDFTVDPAGYAYEGKINTKVPALPSTGGMGTYIFTIAGVAILAIASAMLIVKRRKA